MQLRNRIGLGTAPLGSYEGGPLWWGPQDRATAVATVRAALDAGVDWVDTAPFYGWGRAEEIVGEAIRGRRNEVTVLTKCGTVRRPDGSWANDGSPTAIRSDLEASLTRLGTDHVDALQLHDPDPAVPVEETVGALAELVAEGKGGAIGLSNHDVGLLRRGHAVAGGGSRRSGSNRVLGARTRPRLGVGDGLPDRGRADAGRGAGAHRDSVSRSGAGGQLERGDRPDHEHGG
jgi:aryl-alcohol dehydrogenase-like predicted oxidoreductase